jgi:carboxymethylenebutenolidase
MGRISLTGRFDDAVIGAWHEPHQDARRGGLVLCQEIFGVTDHIRDLAAGFAADGYEVIAPSFYDRLEPGFECDYSQASVAKGVEYSAATPWDQVAGDLQAAVEALQGPVYVVGYCWGGTAAWLAACLCSGVTAASCYYGRRISEMQDLVPRCPTILHYGKTDASIPMDRVDALAELHPDLAIYRYDAGHGFSSDRRKDYDADSARLARLRTLALFHRAGGARGEV